MTRFDSNILRTLVVRAVAIEGLRPLARRLGVGVGTLRSISDGRDFQTSSLEKICTAFGIDLFFGDPSQSNPIPTTIIGDNDFSALDLQNVEASAGPGHLNDNDTAIGSLAFKNEWLERMSIKPDQASLIRVRGESMMPTLQHGAVVLVDHQKNEIKNHNVYALNDQDGSTRVKRIELIPGQAIILRSDNPTFDTEVRMKSDMNRLQIVGQVVWSGRVWK